MASVCDWTEDWSSREYALDLLFGLWRLQFDMCLVTAVWTVGVAPPAAQNYPIGFGVRGFEFVPENVELGSR